MGTSVIEAFVVLKPVVGRRGKGGRAFMSRLYDGDDKAAKAEIIF